MLWKATGLKQFFAAATNYKALEMTGSINEAVVKNVFFLKFDGELKFFFFAEEEINATAVRYCRSSPG